MVEPPRTALASASPGVLGRSAVLTTTTLLMSIGVLQLAGVPVSMAVASFGGRPLDIAWALSLIFSWVYAVAAALVARRVRVRTGWRVSRLATVIERMSAACLCIGLTLYAVAVVSTNGLLGGSLMALALCASASINVIGRQVYLARQTRSLLEPRGGGAK